MAYANIMKCLVIALSLAIVRCDDPVCSAPCTLPQKCKRTCQTDAGDTVFGVDLSVCEPPGDQACGTGGKCKSVCVDPVGTPDCSALSCSSTDACKWTCARSGTPITDADLDGCVSSTSACGSTTETGQCKAACKSNPGKTPTKAAASASPPPTGAPAATTVAPGGTTAKPPGSGSIMHGLSPLVLMCGILAKLFLSA